MLHFIVFYTSIKVWATLRDIFLLTICLQHSFWTYLFVSMTLLKKIILKRDAYLKYAKIS